MRSGNRHLPATAHRWEINRPPSIHHTRQISVSPFCNSKTHSCIAHSRRDNLHEAQATRDNCATATRPPPSQLPGHQHPHTAHVRPPRHPRPLPLGLRRIETAVQRGTPEDRERYTETQRRRDAEEQTTQQRESITHNTEREHYTLPTTHNAQRTHAEFSPVPSCTLPCAAVWG